MVKVPPSRPSITEGTGNEFTNCGCDFGFKSGWEGDDKLPNKKKMAIEKYFKKVNIFFINRVLVCPAKVAFSWKFFVEGRQYRQ